jgi:hypothetical protein
MILFEHKHAVAAATDDDLRVPGLAVGSIHSDLIGALRGVHLPDHQPGAGGPGADDLGCGFARPGVERATRAVQLVAVNGDHFPSAEAAPRL